MLTPTKRDPARVSVESLHKDFAPIGKVVNVSKGEAVALVALGRARVLKDDTPAPPAPAVEAKHTETKHAHAEAKHAEAKHAEAHGGSNARAARPARGTYNRSDMQAGDDGRTDKDG